MNSEFENVQTGYRDPKRKLLYYLKVLQNARLAELADLMKISKMAVHKHLVQLQKRGLVESFETRKGVGRPKMSYQLTRQSKSVFPKSYGELAVHALDFIEKTWANSELKKYFKSVRMNFTKDTM